MTTGLVRAVGTLLLVALAVVAIAGGLLEWTRGFPVHPGADVIGASFVLAGLVFVLLVPLLYRALSFERRGDELVVRLERPPRTPREEVAPAADVQTVQVTPRRTPNLVVFELKLQVQGRAPIDLCVGLSSEAEAQRWARNLDAQIRSLLDA